MCCIHLHDTSYGVSGKLRTITVFFILDFRFHILTDNDGNQRSQRTFRTQFRWYSGMYWCIRISSKWNKREWYGSWDGTRSQILQSSSPTSRNRWYREDVYSAHDWFKARTVRKSTSSWKNDHWVLECRRVVSSFGHRMRTWKNFPLRVDIDRCKDFWFQYWRCVVWKCRC